MRRFLVTGGAGFVGSNLLRALIEKGETDIHVCVSKTTDRFRLTEIEDTLTFHVLDISDAESVARVVKEVQPTHVFHLAQYGGNRGENDAARIRKVVIEGTAALYTACLELPALEAVVHTGSSSEYGTQHVAMCENMVPAPITEYGVAKVWATIYGEMLRTTKNAPITTLRLFSVYGPYEAGIRFFPAVMRALMKGEDPTLASRDTARDFVYVTDVVEALIQALDAPKGVYNIGSGKSTTLEEAAETIKKVCSSEKTLVWGGESGRSFDTTIWCADTTHTEKILGWKAQTNLVEGVTMMNTWMKQHFTPYES